MEVHVTFDPSPVSGSLSPYGLTWDQQMDLIHYSVVSKLDPSISLYHRIQEHLTKRNTLTKQSILWILTQWVDEAWLSLPVLEDDEEWLVHRDLDETIQTRLYSVPKNMNVDECRIWLNRFRLYLTQESKSGTTVSQETFKHLDGYISTLGVYSGTRQFVNRHRHRR